MVTKMRERRPVRLWQVAAVAILVLGTVGITLGALAWYSTNKHHNVTELQASSDQIAVTTRKTLDGYNDQIASAVALFKQPGLINRAEFHAYVKNLDLYTSYKGIYGVGLISWVPSADLPAFVAGWRVDEPGFSVLPAGNRPAYCLVSAFDQQNLKSPVPLTGYDLCTFKTLLPVLDAATKSGKEQAVVESALVPGPAYRGNFLSIAPVYSGVPTTPADRSSERIGWVAALVDGRQMLAAALGPAAAHLEVELSTGPGVSPSHLVVSSPSGLKPNAEGSVTEHFTDGGTWTLRIRTLPGAPGPANPLEGPGLVFVTALLLNLALAAFVWDLGQGRLRAMRSFTVSERRFQSLASYTPVGILEMAEDGTTLYFNPRLNEIAGVDDAFWRDHSWLDCVHPDDRASVVATALAARKSRDDTGANFRVLRPSGDIRSVRMLAAPVTTDAGGPLSFVITVQDVTDEVAATEALAFQAMHDSLTGLPNRALFLDRLGHELASAARSGRATWRSCSWTSTASRSSTTAWVTRPGTNC